MAAPTTDGAGISVAPLGAEHVRADFSSGAETLDRYLRTQAGQDIRRRVASCFVLTEAGSAKALGYYTLSSATIALADLPPKLAAGLPRYPMVPATLMGRLAVDHRRHGQGLGEFLLFDAFARALRNEIATYASLVDAKDDSARAFYERYAFRRLTSDDPRRHFLPMAEIARLFK